MSSKLVLHVSLCVTVSTPILRSWLRLSSNIMRNPDAPIERRSQHAHQLLRLHLALDFAHWGLQEIQDGEFAERVLYDAGHGFLTPQCAHREMCELIDQHRQALAAQGHHYAGLPAILHEASVNASNPASQQNAYYQPTSAGYQHSPQPGPSHTGPQSLNITAGARQQSYTQSGPPRPEAFGDHGESYDNAFSLSRRQRSPQDRRSRSPLEGSIDYRDRRTQIQQRPTGIPSIPPALRINNVTAGTPFIPPGLRTNGIPPASQTLRPPPAPTTSHAQLPTTTSISNLLFPGFKRWCGPCQNNTFLGISQAWDHSREYQFCRNCRGRHPENVYYRTMAGDLARQAQLQQNRAHAASMNEMGVGQANDGLTAGGGVAGTFYEGDGRSHPSAKALGKRPVREDAVPLDPRAANVRGRTAPPASDEPRPAPNVEHETGQGSEGIVGNMSLPESRNGESRAPRDEAEDAGNDGEAPDADVAEAETAAAEGEGEDEECRIGQWAAEEYARAAGTIARSDLLAKQNPPCDNQNMSE
ncbi:hypothetical protein LTR86_002420 [Recurvomyces mirabilis]|nr:hypothetical protein LTR86_002420 [Recurvomyces mirabilis]